MIMENMEVLEAFNQASNDYDKYRIKAIPNMHIYYDTAVNLTKTFKNPKILDLGAGTGILTKMLSQQHPDSDITLIDISSKMLNLAKEKFKDENYKYIIADYLEYEFEEKYDIIVSSLSIHHLNEEEKKKLYEKIYNSLKPKGIFINADLIKGSTDKSEELFKKMDSTYLDSQSMPEEDKKIIRKRRLLDKPSKLQDTIRYYEKIGFVDIEVYYKYYRYVVIAGEKNNNPL